MKPKRIKTAKEIETEWYAKLKTAGFQDIEDTSKPDRPLKQWHSRKFISEKSMTRQAQRENYNKMIDNFINSRVINEICGLMTAHGNNVLKPEGAKKILELHRDGLPQRKIAQRMKISQKCVHHTLEKARTWMKLAS